MFAALIPLEIVVATGIVGAILVLAGLLMLFGGEYVRTMRCGPAYAVAASAPAITSGSDRATSKAPRPPLGVSITRWQLGLLLAIIVAAALLRLDGLDQKTMSHPEVYVPGIRLPDGISEPPPRLTFDQVVWWHFHDEPHPQGYYFLMWPWTQLFGTSLWSIRLPSVLFGIGSVVLTFLVASRSSGVTIGLISAALLAFNGFQIYWSQMARMYAMTCFLGLLSTLLLLQLVTETRVRPVREALYVFVSFLGAFTEILFWPFLFAQAAWVLVHCRTAGKGVPRVLVLQALTAILGAPLWAHAVYRARTSPMDGSPGLFITQFLSFGFLFEDDLFSDPVRLVPLPATVLLAALAALCLGRGLASRCSWMEARSIAGGLAARQLVPIMTGIVLLIFVEALVAYGRRWHMILTAVVPVAAVLVLWALERWWPLVQRTLDSLYTRVPPARGFSSLYAYLVFLPSLIMLAVSSSNYLLGSRLFLLFTPYVLILSAIGLADIGKRRILVAALSAAIISVHLLSIMHFRTYPSEVIDYAGLSQELARRYNQDDLIFVRNRDWASTPIFYYLTDTSFRFVTDGFDDAVRANSDSRVWVIHFKDYPPPPAMQAALTGFQLEEQVEARHGFASLYTRR